MGIGQALAPPPADRLALIGCQWIGDQGIVVDRHERRAEAIDPPGVRRRGDDHVRRTDDRAVRRGERDATGATLEPRDPRVLVQANAALPRDPGDPATQLGRVHENVTAGWSVEPGMPQRRMDLRLGCLAIEELHVLAVLGGFVDPCPELVDLVGSIGEGERARLLEIAVDAVLAREGDEALEVLDALPFERLELVGEVADAIREPMREAGLAEPAVAPAGTEPDGLHLQDGDPERRVRVGQRDRRPEPGEARADDRDVDVEPLAARERRIRDVRGRGVTKPVRDRVAHPMHPCTLGKARVAGYAGRPQGAAEGSR
jgi:hypothetical protein